MLTDDKQEFKKQILNACQTEREKALIELLIFQYEWHCKRLIQCDPQTQRSDYHHGACQVCERLLDVFNDILSRGVHINKYHGIYRHVSEIEYNVCLPLFFECAKAIDEEWEQEEKYISSWTQHEYALDVMKRYVSLDENALKLIEEQSRIIRAAQDIFGSLQNR